MLMIESWQLKTALDVPFMLCKLCPELCRSNDLFY